MVPGAGHEPRQGAAAASTSGVRDPGRLGRPGTGGMSARDDQGDPGMAAPTPRQRPVSQGAEGSLSEPSAAPLPAAGGKALDWVLRGRRAPPPAAVRAGDGRAGPPMVPVAWLGRTSTEDSQDPTISLPRQLRNSR